MSRLIDADKIDFNEGFVGASEFAQDTRNAAQMLIDNQPTAFDLDKVVEQLDDEANRSYADFKKYADEIGESESDNWYYIGLRRAIGIVKGGGN